MDQDKDLDFYQKNIKTISIFKTNSNRKKSYSSQSIRTIYKFQEIRNLLFGPYSLLQNK